MKLPKSDPKTANIYAKTKDGKSLGMWSVSPGDTLTLTFKSEYEDIAKLLFEENKLLKKKLKGIVAE